MTRSILWISSSAPLSPFSSACTGLPQPRSRIAVAADTRAAGVASFAFMTPTRALMAVRVWLRASERISVRVLGISWVSPRHGPARHLRMALCRHDHSLRATGEMRSSGNPLAHLWRRDAEAERTVRLPHSGHGFPDGDRDQEHEC